MTGGAVLAARWPCRVSGGLRRSPWSWSWSAGRRRRARPGRRSPPTTRGRSGSTSRTPARTRSTSTTPGARAATRVRIDLSAYGGGPNSVDVSREARRPRRRGGRGGSCQRPGHGRAPRHARAPRGERAGRAAARHGHVHPRRASPPGRANEGERQSDERRRRGQRDRDRHPARPAQGPRPHRDARRRSGSSATSAETVGMEPEYIAAAPDDRLAYVSIQEANAIGVLDVDDAIFRFIRGLGAKSWLPRQRQRARPVRRGRRHPHRPLAGLQLLPARRARGLHGGAAHLGRDGQRG